MITLHNLLAQDITKVWVVKDMSRVLALTQKPWKDVNGWEWHTTQEYGYNPEPEQEWTEYYFQEYDIETSLSFIFETTPNETDCLEYNLTERLFSYKSLTTERNIYGITQTPLNHLF